MARQSLVAFAPLLLCSIGCVNTLWSTNRPAALNSHGPSAAQVHTIWESRVLVTRDSVNNGAPLAGLAGRLYLFGPEIGRGLDVAGEVRVELYEIVAGEKPRLQEKWHIDKAALRRLGKADSLVGWGYTLFLPWQGYHPDIGQVQLHLSFIPEKGGNPLYAPISTISLRNEGNIPIAQQMFAPGDARANAIKN